MPVAIPFMKWPENKYHTSVYVSSYGVRINHFITLGGGGGGGYGEEIPTSNPV